MRVKVRVTGRTSFAGTLTGARGELAEVTLANGMRVIAPANKLRLR